MISMRRWLFLTCLFSLACSPRIFVAQADAGAEETVDAGFVDAGPSDAGRTSVVYSGQALNLDAGFAVSQIARH